MDDPPLSRREILSLLIRMAIALGATYLSVKYLVKAMDPTAAQKKKAEKKAKEMLKKLNIKTELKELTEHEQMIASQLIMPSELNTTWEDIAGLSSTIEDLRETLILPIYERSKKNSSKLIQPPKGILLHGPPGCGKTLMARAVAREASANFINLDVSSLTDKWYGESQKLSSAVFSLAAKLEPCIIFIDEIDSFLRVRSSGDHEATAMMKSQFLQQWDGLATDHSHSVIVMGATNRPHDVDKAILRRMPAEFHIPLPNESQRKSILSLILKEENLAKDVNLLEVAANTDTFSGSDLKELCRITAVSRLRPMLNRSLAGGGSDDLNRTREGDDVELCPIAMENFRTALRKMRTSRLIDCSRRELLKVDLD